MTGYDFLEDTAVEVQNEFKAGIGPDPDTLIAAQDLAPELGWTAEELGTLFLTGRHDLIFLAGRRLRNQPDYHRLC